MQLERNIQDLRGYIEHADFSGYDPYDALNSPVIRALSLGLKYGRIGWTQLLRRMPINLRPLLLIRKGHNPKGIGVCLWGYAKLHARNPDQRYEERIAYLMGILDSLRSEGYSGNCWGYNFDWQSRVFYVPRWTPTIVNTAFIGHALLDTYHSTGNQQALDLVVPISDFMLNDLNRTVEGDTFCFSYTPIDKLAIHNANMMGASLLIRLSELTGDSKTREAALASLAYSMRHQHEDGSWFYAEAATTQYIDSFHTGFNLQALRYFLKAGESQEYKAAYERGVQFYSEHLFLEDGTPKYYHDRTYPIDIHSAAQAVVFFSGEGKIYRDLTDLVLGWMIDNLYDQRGYFYFRKGRYLTNRISYMRWSQAWAFHALTEYEYFRHAS